MSRGVSPRGESTGGQFTEDWPGEGLDTLGRAFDVLYRLRRLYHVVYSIKSRVADEKRPEPERIVVRKSGVG